MACSLLSFFAFFVGLLFFYLHYLSTLGRTFKPTKTFHLFLRLLLKHAQNPLLVILKLTSLPPPQKKILNIFIHINSLARVSSHFRMSALLPTSLFRFCRRPLTSSLERSQNSFCVCVAQKLLLNSTQNTENLAKLVANL